MSFSALNWAWDQKAPSGVAKSVLVYLANCASQTGGDCYPSVQTISRHVQHGEETVRKALAQLVAADLIEIQPRSAKSGRQMSNLYRLPVVSIATPPNSGGYAPSWATPLEIGGYEICASPEGEAPEIEGVTPLNLGENPSEDTSKEERALLRNGDAEVRAVVATPDVDVKTLLWDEGKAIVRNLTGKLDGEARKQVGAFLRSAGGDCTIVLDVLRAAAREGPHLPVPWVVAGIQARLRPEPTYRMPANQIADAYGLHDKAHREKFAAGLTRDYSGFLNGGA